MWRYAKERPKKLNLAVKFEDAYPTSPGAVFGVMPTTDPFSASAQVIELLLADSQVARQLVGIPKSNIPGVQSLASLMARMTMWDQQQWLNHDPHVLSLRALTTEFLDTNDFTPATIMNLVSKFTRLGLSPDEAHHLPIEEAVRQLDALSSNETAKKPIALKAIQASPTLVVETTTNKSRPLVIGCDDEDILILNQLRENAPNLCTIVQIEADTKLSNKTIGKRLNLLIEHGLACSPKGKRSGATVSDEGIAMLNKAGIKVTG